MSEKHRLRVLIAGGGVAGLTLANALERGGVDFLLLERRNELAPQVGASIGISANGCRILDQMGIYDALVQRAAPVVMHTDRDKDGHPVAPRSDSPLLGRERTGYQFAFGDRKNLLECLVGGIQDEKKLMVNKNITDVIHSADKVTVKCADGTTYDGDILVGADGVRSKTRQALWKIAEKESPKEVEKDREALTAEYQCLFGICSQMPGMDIGDLDYGYDHHRSSLTMVSQGGRTYYFIFRKLDRLLRGNEMPLYTRDDVEKFVKDNADMKLRPNVTLSMVWQKTISANLVVLEEAEYLVWTSGRIVCAGDSIHKMTPNVGFGGNSAIESAAVLANVLRELADSTSGHRPSENQVTQALRSYQQTRQKRVVAVFKSAALATRLQAMDNTAAAFFVRYCLQFLGDALSDLIGDMTVSAPAIDFLPLPARSFTSTMPFNPEQGEGNRESRVRRALIGLPFVILAFLAPKYLIPAPVLTGIETISRSGKVSWGNESVAMQFYGVRWLDQLLAPMIALFSPAYAGLDTVVPQATTFLVDYGVVVSIWLIESTRRANALTLVQIPLLITLLSQFLGVGLISPAYYLLHYIFTPIEKFKATDMRLTQISYTKAVIPTLILGYYIPLYASFYSPSFSARVSWGYVWQLFPVWISLLAYFVMSRLFRDTTALDRIYKPTSDLGAIRTTVGLLAVNSAATWLFIFAKAGFSATKLLDLVVPKFNVPAADFAALASNVFRFDAAFFWANTFIWMGYMFWDIKHAGMLRVSWVWIVFFAVGATVILGPGAAVGLGFLWREELLATRRHKAALTKEVGEMRNRKLAAAQKKM